MTNNSISILLVDDQEIQKTLVQDSIEEIKEDEQIEITLDYVKNYSDALEHLLKNNYEAAIIDLKLDDNPEKHLGNELVKIIVDKLRMPLIVCTGFPEKFDHDLVDEKNGFFLLCRKGSSIDEIILQILKWYKSGFTKIFGKNGVWETQLHSIFWELISKNIEEWSSHQGGLSDEKIIDSERALLRYSLNIMQSYLELNVDKSDYDLLHPAEFYIMPPLYSKPMFGDIVKSRETKKLYTVLTPACEMANEKYSKILLAEIKDLLLVEEFKLDYEKQAKIIFDEENKQVEQKKKAIAKLGKWFRNGHNSSNGLHFLPKFGVLEGGFIDFQSIHTITGLELEDEYERVATITVQFAKDIASRFSSYYARQGQPSLAEDIISYSLKFDHAR